MTKKGKETMEHSRVTIVLSVVAGVIIGFLLGISYVPTVTVTEFEPAAIRGPAGSLRSPGPDLVQPGDEQAVVIPVTCTDGFNWVSGPHVVRCPMREYGVAIPAVIDRQSGYSMRWCSDGQIWPARSDGSCWMADKPER